MEVYKIPISFAFITFPFIAFILTIPFLIYQYRKYGAIPILKSIIFYSLILYLICAYFLVILPLPSLEHVKQLTTPTTQLKLFQFLKDINFTTNGNLNILETIVTFLKQPAVYTVLFNLVLTLPFGVYMHYFFNKKWYQTLTYSFLLSLFFELTQLSGLYGIYPRAYRLFDVDDLLINTVGGLLGHIITPIFTLFLPTKKELEIMGYKKGQKVSLLRRFVSLTIDACSLLIICLILKVLTYGTFLQEYTALFAITVYYIIIAPLISGRTIGKQVVKLEISGIERKAKWYQIVLRNFLMVYFTLYPFVWVDVLAKTAEKAVINRLWLVIGIWQCINILYYFKTLRAPVHQFLYEHMTKTKNISTIKSDFITEDEKDEKHLDKKEESRKPNN